MRVTVKITQSLTADISLVTAATIISSIVTTMRVTARITQSLTVDTSLVTAESIINSTADTIPATVRITQNSTADILSAMEILTRPARYAVSFFASAITEMAYA